MKISHTNSKVVSAIINRLNKQNDKTASGKDIPLTIKRGKVHDYLGMTLDYRTKGKVKIDTRDYIKKKEIEHLIDGWEGTAITPATENLFKINQGALKLEKMSSESFHHIVTQLLFLCK